MRTTCSPSGRCRDAHQRSLSAARSFWRDERSRGDLPYLDLSALLPQKVRELSGVALAPLGHPGGEEEGHLGVRGDVAVELDEPSLPALPARPDVEPSPVATRRLPRRVAGGITGRPPLDPRYPLREEPDQMVQIISRTRLWCAPGQYCSLVGRRSRTSACTPRSMRGESGLSGRRGRRSL